MTFEEPNTIDDYLYQINELMRNVNLIEGVDNQTAILKTKNDYIAETVLKNKSI